MGLTSRPELPATGPPRPSVGKALPQRRVSALELLVWVPSSDGEGEVGLLGTACEL